MKIEDFAKAFPAKVEEIRAFTEGSDIKDIMGVEAVNHFRESFDNEGFTDEVLNPWKEVERRKPESPWYGHSGQTGRFSPERTTAPILTGETGELKAATRYKYIPGGVRISNEKPYAAVHQFGLPAKIYGKKSFTMPTRPFIGKSKALVRKIEDKIKRQLIDIIKR